MPGRIVAMAGPIGFHFLEQAGAFDAETAAHAREAAGNKAVLVEGGLFALLPLIEEGLKGFARLGLD